MQSSTSYGDVAEESARLISTREERHRVTSYDSCEEEEEEEGGRRKPSSTTTTSTSKDHAQQQSSSNPSRRLALLLLLTAAVATTLLLFVSFAAPDFASGVGKQLSLITYTQVSASQAPGTDSTSTSAGTKSTTTTSGGGGGGTSGGEVAVVDTNAATASIYSISGSSAAASTDYDYTNKIAISNVGTVVSVQPMPTEPIDFDLARDGYDVIETLSEEYLKYTFLDHYDVVIEPYASMNLVVDGMNETTTYYRYSVCPYESTNPSDCSIGTLMPTGYPDATTSVNVTCASYDKYYIYVTEFDMTTEQMTRTTTGSALCMYVRREIRTLSDEDLSATMDAMYALWEYDQDEGEELYGEYFMAASTLLKFHHFNSAWQDADHIHEGNGFLLQHIKQSNIFEKSMQQVDPSVSLPYWDFTIESANGTAIWESEIFSADVFGSMPNCSDSWWGFQSWEDIEDARIPDGRWANIKADWNDEYDDLLAGYGYMRAPWSMNPSPYVSRFTTDWQIGTTLPRCSSHYGMLEYTDLMDFLMDAGDDPHSSAHSLIGGMYGCDYFSPMLASNLINDHTGMMTICGKWAFVMKELYRNNLIAPLTNCSTNTNVCGFECLNEDDDSGDLLFLVKELISDSVPSTLSVKQWEKWEDFICEGDGYKIVPGDHLESASPTDPSFWPIHPTLERLLQAKFMSGGFENNTWHSDPETENVCHHASCYLASQNGTAFYPECCYGHFQFDQMLNALTGSKYEFYGPTNDAILLGTNPTGLYTMPYIYDKFDWGHCLDVDVDFDDLLDTFYKDYVTHEDDYMDDTFNSTGNFTIHAVHTPSPTKMPSEFPTAKPTHSPDTTKKPTFEPTEKPTHSPDSTRLPTHEPTQHPTHKPTHSPDYTHRPTFEPTAKPSRSPDFTHSPTNPTAQPSPWPSDMPTTKPTRSPDATHAPTFDLDTLPGNSYPPTYEPSARPSHSPDWSAEPSFEPSALPSYSPAWSAKPTHLPTPLPTAKPTRKPSFHPTVTGYTHRPTHKPTHRPTHAPDWTPEPTDAPTMDPTDAPTEVPSPAPSGRFDLFVTAETSSLTKSASGSASSASLSASSSSSSNNGVLSGISTRTSSSASRAQPTSKPSKSSKRVAAKTAKPSKGSKASKKDKSSSTDDAEQADDGTNDDDREESKKAAKAEKKAKREAAKADKKKRAAKRKSSYKPGDKNERFRLFR